ncbi:hypothetical protein NXW50_31025 [Bacteroides thetaiotaomicron]|nr:hypothetical protein [Bacteroides thetaiotaomicron]MCS2282399.1 hypothetical protein [Bacteroides thetaiotaomicron]
MRWNHCPGRHPSDALPVMRSDAGSSTLRNMSHPFDTPFTVDVQRYPSHVAEYFHTLPPISMGMSEMTVHRLREYRSGNARRATVARRVEAQTCRTRVRCRG